ncbi:MAG: hypothetical protein JNJ54_16315 [Myxococcaceae bacterium]|nr:hypothetical protein [Myxococcaceae bacterium]
MTRCALLTLLGATLAFADLPSPRPPGCRVDGDCVMSDFQGCCGDCCPAPPSAWLRSELERQQRRCAIVDCAAPVCSTPCAPAPQQELVAVCEAGRCVARPPARNADPDFCAADGDCISTTFAGCCGACCPVPPTAVTRRRAELQQQQCAAVRCRRPACEGIACAQVVPAPIRPVCRANRCVAEPTNLVPVPPPAQCRADADCGVDLNPPPGSACWSSPCGCCPSPRAVPVEQVRPPPVRRTSEGKGAPFGLSQGTTGAAPSCGPCPAPTTPLGARCWSGRCALVPR